MAEWGKIAARIRLCAVHTAPNRTLSLGPRTSPGAPSAAAQAPTSAIRSESRLQCRHGRDGVALLAAPMAMVRLLATATAALGGLALLLAIVGLYGVLALFVAQRTP